MPAAALFIIFSLLLYGSCSGDSGGPAGDLVAYCVRECVIETSAAEICGTRCSCAVSKLADRMSEQDLGKLSEAITKNGATDSRDSAELKDALENCTGEK